MNNVFHDLKENLTQAQKRLEKGDSEGTLALIESALAKVQSMSPDDKIFCVPEGVEQVFFPARVNRFEAIHHKPNDDNARQYVTYDAKGIEVSIQDHGRTAKVFVNDKGAK